MRYGEKRAWLGYEPECHPVARDAQVAPDPGRFGLGDVLAKEREVVELAYWSGMSQSEVAEYLHIPLGTVKTRTRSALSRLAGVLEGEELA